MRRSKKYSRPVRPINAEAMMGGVHYEESHDGTQYKVHHIVRGTKQYICPGCQGVILPGESHEVAWTEDTFFGAEYGQEQRRHWHTSCWRHRGRR